MKDQNCVCASLATTSQLWLDSGADVFLSWLELNISAFAFLFLLPQLYTDCLTAT